MKTAVVLTQDANRSDQPEKMHWRTKSASPGPGHPERVCRRECLLTRQKRIPHAARSADYDGYGTLLRDGWSRDDLATRELPLRAVSLYRGQRVRRELGEHQPLYFSTKI